MKALLKWANFMALLWLIPVALTAQTKAVSTGKQSAPIKKTAAAVSNKQISITIKNSSEKSVSIFAGSKTEIKNPKTKTKSFGGLSKNTVYVKISDVVCLMNAQEKPTACTDIKATTTVVEINSSANGISGK